MDVCQDHVYVLSWLLRPVRSIFYVRRAPKLVYPHFYDFSMLFFWSSRFPRQKCKNVLCTCVKNFGLLLIEPQSQSDPFLRSNKHRSEHAPLILMIFVCYVANNCFAIRIPTSKMKKVLVDVRQNLGYASGWPSWQFRTIFKL